MRDPETTALLSTVRDAVVEARRAGVSEQACLWDVVVAAVDKGGYGVPSSKARRLADAAARLLEPARMADRVEATNTRGEWVPAIPLPLYGPLRKRCECGARFWTLGGYRGHYTYAHILALAPQGHR